MVLFCTSIPPRFVLSAVSPAVVVPSMLSLTEKGLGVNKGIPTLVIAAASVDDVLAISGFGVILGITFSKGVILITSYLTHFMSIAIFNTVPLIIYQDK